MIVENRAQQVGAIEIGPQRIGDIQLRISDLPQQEIADAHLAGGADQQVGVGRTGGVEPRRDGLFVDHNVVASRVFKEGLHRVDQLRASTVVDRQVDLQSAIPSRRADRFVKLGAHKIGQSFNSSDRREPNIVASHIRKFGAQIEAQKTP